MSKMHFRFSLTPPNPSLILLEGQTTAALSLALMVIFISGDQYNVPGTEVPLSSCRSVLPASTAVNGNLFAKCPPFAISPAGRVGSQGGQLDMNHTEGSKTAVLHCWEKDDSKRVTKALQNSVWSSHQRTVITWNALQRKLSMCFSCCLKYSQATYMSTAGISKKCKSHSRR